ncbi:hypothetical protein LIA77_08423 [Sarocladium implicatum]|nr:hypothetical protein LIA77_08423 [Sarocladium implicatum]
MGYDLYVITMGDHTWRFVPYTYNAQARISTFYMKGGAGEPLDLVKETINEDDGGIKSWESVDNVSERDFVKVQDAMNLAFTMDMSRHQDALKMEEVDWSTVERYGNWSQTFVVLALKRMEREKVVKEGTVEKFKEMI